MHIALAPRANRVGPVGRFLLHYFEMCIPMCIGFAVGDAAYFWAAGLRVGGCGLLAPASSLIDLRSGPDAPKLWPAP